MNAEGLAAQIKAEREARELLARADCRHDGHAPATVIRAADRVLAVAAYCACGAVGWTPTKISGANL